MKGPTPPIRQRGKRLELWGVRFTPFPLPKLIEELRDRLRAGERGIVIFTPDARAFSLAILRKDLRVLLNEAEYVVCDGVGVSLAARAFGARLPRVAGVDLAWELCRMAAEEGLSVYLLGARPEEVKKATTALTAAFPGLRLVGHHHGYFRGAGPVEEIRALSPDLLFVGMGFPKQERWILAHRRCGAGILMGVGSTFDIWSGRFPRAPRWVREVGLEWLWRAFQDPRRVRKLWAVPFLLVCIAWSWIRWHTKAFLKG